MQLEINILQIYNQAKKQLELQFQCLTINVLNYPDISSVDYIKHSSRIWESSNKLNDKLLLITFNLLSSSRFWYGYCQLILKHDEHRQWFQANTLHLHNNSVSGLHFSYALLLGNDALWLFYGTHVMHMYIIASSLLMQKSWPDYFCSSV